MIGSYLNCRSTLSHYSQLSDCSVPLQLCRIISAKKEQLVHEPIEFEEIVMVMIKNKIGCKASYTLFI